MSKKNTLNSTYKNLQTWMKDSGYIIPTWVKEGIDRLYNSATIDPLTRLLGPEAIKEEFEVKEHERRQNKGKSCLIVYDVDNFKGINKFGKEEVGDKVLRRLGRALNKLRTTDYAILGRYSGGADELIVYLSDTNTDGALIADARLRKYIDEEKAKAISTLEIYATRVKKRGTDINKKRINSMIRLIEGINITGCIIPIDPYKNSDKKFKELFRDGNNGIDYLKEYDGRGSTASYEDISKNLSDSKGIDNE